MANRLQSRLKRFVKLVISLGVFSFSCLRDIILRLSGTPLPARCVILYYHSVPFEQREQFARQMDTLIRRAEPIPADRRSPLSAGKRYVAVTFDDAFESVVQNALPELEKRKIPATVFVIADVVGRPPGWDGYPERTMTLEQLKQLPAELVAVGSHTLTHPALPLLTEQEARSEISQSRKKLEELLNRKVSLFSFPYGAFEECMIEWCREAGYERVFTTLPCPGLIYPEEFVTGRVSVEPTDWPLEFRLKLFGAYYWLPWAFSIKRKIFRGRHLKGASMRKNHTRGRSSEAGSTGSTNAAIR